MADSSLIDQPVSHTEMSLGADTDDETLKMSPILFVPKCH
jgi:hypothetical protein